MVSDADYRKLVKKAEVAVRSVKDPELKRVAFGRVLSDLLGHSRSSGSPAPAGRKTEKKIQASESKSAVPRGPRGYLQELVDDGFFRKPKAILEVKAELENRGHHILRTSLSGPLQVLCQKRILRRQKKVIRGKKAVYNYSDW